MPRSSSCRSSSSTYVAPRDYADSQTTRVADDPELATDGETARRSFSELAKEHNVAIVGGIVEHESGGDPRDSALYNVAYYIRADGEVLCRCTLASYTRGRADRSPVLVELTMLQTSRRTFGIRSATT